MSMHRGYGHGKGFMKALAMAVATGALGVVDSVTRRIKRESMDAPHIRASSSNKFRPHCSDRECARRKKQIIHAPKAYLQMAAEQERCITKVKKR